MATESVQDGLQLRGKGDPAAILIILVAAVVVGGIWLWRSQDHEDVAPAPPGASAARRLLDDLKALDRPFGLAIIAATPAALPAPDMPSLVDVHKAMERGQPERALAALDEMKRANSGGIKLAEQKRAFLEGCQPASTALEAATAALEKYAGGAKPEDWLTAWRDLQSAHGELVKLCDSEPWRNEVPTAEATAMKETIAKLHEAMHKLQADANKPSR